MSLSFVETRRDLGSVEIRHNFEELDSGKGRSQVAPCRQALSERSTRYAEPSLRGVQRAGTSGVMVLLGGTVAKHDEGRRRSVLAFVMY